MGGNMSGMISLLLVVAFMWFLLIRPQQKQAKKYISMGNNSLENKTGGITYEIRICQRNLRSKQF